MTNYKPVPCLGLDLASLTSGWGLVHRVGDDMIFITCGHFEAKPTRKPKDKAMSTRLDYPRLFSLYRQATNLAQHLQSTYTQPITVAVETCFVGKSGRGTVTLAHARALQILPFLVIGCPIVEYAPATIKQMVALSGRAQKSDMISAVQSILRVEINFSEHQADALAAAIAYLQPTGDEIE